VTLHTPVKQLFAAQQYPIFTDTATLIKDRPAKSGKNESGVDTECDLVKDGSVLVANILQY
jgi:hypothetical protein